jgi:hypothetical protein
VAVSFVAASGANFASSASPTSVTPAGVQDGDLLLIFFNTDTGSNANGTPPTGVTIVGQQSNGTDNTIAVFKKIAASEGANIAFTNIYDALETGRVIVMAYRGVNTTTPMDVAAVFSTDSATAWDTAAIVPVTANAMLVASFGADPASDPYTFAWDSPIVERIDSSTTPTGQNGTLSYQTMGERVLASPASTTMGGDVSVSDSCASVILALRPAPSDVPFDAAPGSYAVTGSSATLVAGRSINAAAGSYAVTGAPAGLLATHLLSLTPGVYAVTGSSSTLVAARLLSANPGTYLVVGFDAQLLLVGAPTLQADPGAYTVTGFNAGLIIPLQISADPGAYVVNGAPAALAIEQQTVFGSVSFGDKRTGT